MQDHGLRQLDERLAGEPADFDDAAFEPLESLEKALDDMFTVRPANAVPAEVAPTGPVPRQRTAELSPRRPQSRPGFERRVQQGTRFDRACPHGEPRPPLSRSERAAEFARAMREGPASDTSLPEANSSDSGTTDSFSRLLAVAGAISFIHAILTAMSWPLRFVPPRRRVWVNWLAIALAFWTPIVWLVTLFISG